MAVVGSAHVVIRALTDKLQADIQAGLNKSINASSSSGSAAGKAFSDAFNGDTKIGIPGSFGRDVENHAKRAGVVGGAAVGAGVAAGMATGAAKGSQQVVAAAGRAGGSAGSIFGKMFNSSGGGGSRVFISMALRIAALIPLLGALVGGISSVVSGLFAMGAAANNAVYAFAPLPGLVAALVQGGAAIMTAFGGVGTALTAGLKAADVPAQKASKALDGLKTAARDAAEAVRDAAEAVSDAREAVSDAAEGIRDAREAVRDAAKALRDTEEAAAAAIVNANKAVADAKKNRREVHEDAAEAEEEALENVRDAELALADTQKRVQRAQEALTDARKAAEEQLIDLQFASRGGAIAEQRAIMALADARYKLNATSELPVDNRLRQEAQLAYDDAQLNLDMIREKNGDTAESLNEFAEKGVDGTDGVVAAQERLLEAQEDVLDATEAVGDALERQRDVQRGIAEAVRDANEAVKEAKQALRDAYEDAPEMISDAKEALRDAKEALSDSKEALSDAQESLSDAITALADAKKNVGTANAAFAAGIPEVNAYQEALDKLSPPARRFVEFLLSIRERMAGLRTAAAAGLFPGLQTAIENLVYGPLFPAVERMMFSTGQAVANAAIQISKSLSTGVFVSNFSDVVEGNNRTIRRMGLVIGDLVAALFAFMDAAQPVTDQLTEWLVKWADGVRVSTELGNANGTLTTKLLHGSEVMQQLIRITKNLWEGFSDLGNIADTSGQSLLDSFEKATEKFANFTNDPEKVRVLSEQFEQIADNLRAIGDLALVVGGAFFRLGADPAIATIAEDLEKVTRTLENLITELLGRVGDDLALLVDQILIAFEEISKSGGIEVFLQTMSTAVGGLIEAFRTPILGDALRLLVKVGAAMYAISILTKFPGVKLLSSGLGALFSKNDAGISGFGRLKDAIGRVGDGIKKIPQFPSMAKRIAGDVGAWFALRTELLRNRLASLRATAATVAHTAAEKIRAAATKISAAMQAALNFVMNQNPIMRVVAIIGLLVGALVLAYNKFDWFKKIVDTVFGAIVSAAEWLWDVLFGHSIFPDIQKGFEAFFDAVGGIFSGLATFFTETLPNAAMALFNWLIAHWTDIIKVIGGPIGLAVALVVENWDKIKQKFIDIKDWAVDKFANAWDFIKDKIINPIKDAKDAIGRFFGEGGPFRSFFTGIKDWVVGKFSNAWDGVKDKILNPIGDAKDAVGRWFGEDGPIRNFFSGIWTWVRDTFSNSWDKVQSIIESPINAVKTFLTDFFGEGGTIRSAFKDAKDAIGRIWDGMKAIAAEPVNFVIGTVYNEGLRKALNLLPGVDLKEASKIEYASGGVLPGWSPGRDIHNFYSPTAGRLALSGGEAIMRPEFTRAMGGEGAIDRLNRAARAGTLQQFAAGGVFRPTRGGTFGELHFSNASDIAVVKGTPVASVMNGRVRSSYDIAGPLPSDEYDGDGPYGSYGRVITIDHGNGLSSLYAHLSERFARVNQRVDAGMVIGLSGNTGNSSGDHLHFGTTGMSPFSFQYASTAYGTNAGSPLGPSGQTAPTNPGEEERDNWLDIIRKLPGRITGIYDSVSSMGGKGGYYPLIGKAARGVGADVVQWINDKIPNEIKVPNFPDLDLPDNPIHNPFDRGGIAGGEADVWMPKRTARPERVLSPDQTVAFERLVAWLDKNGTPAGGDINLDVHVPHSASAEDVVQGIVYEMRRQQLGGRYSRGS